MTGHGIREVLYSAEDFINRVKTWDGDDEDERAELHAEIRRQLEINDEPSFSHKTGDGLLKRVAKADDEIDTLHAHLRAVVAQGKADATWTGWIHALEMLIPDSEPRRLELEASLRAKGMDDLADRMQAIREGKL